MLSGKGWLEFSSNSTQSWSRFHCYIFIQLISGILIKFSSSWFHFGNLRGLGNHFFQIFKPLDLCSPCFPRIHCIPCPAGRFFRIPLLLLLRLAFLLSFELVLPHYPGWKCSCHLDPASLSFSVSGPPLVFRSYLDCMHVSTSLTLLFQSPSGSSQTDKSKASSGPLERGTRAVTFTFCDSVWRN